MQPCEPTVSVLVAANELTAEQIRKFEEIDYDKTKFELLVGISSSSAEVDNDVKNSQMKISFYENKKSNAEILNDLSVKAANEILLFINADTLFDKNILKTITQNFTEPTVGGVCGKSLLIGGEKNTIEYHPKNIFARYKNLIEQAEDKCGVVISSGTEVFAIRRELYKSIPVEVPININLFSSLSVIEQGCKFTCSGKPVSYRNKTEYSTAGHDKKNPEAVSDFYTVSFFKNLFWNKNKFLSYAFLSRKITDLSLPGLLLLLFLFSFLLANENLFISKIYFLQLAFYLLALGGYLLSSINVQLTIFSLPYYFVMKNAAVAKGFIKFRKEKQNANKLLTEIN
ncbi:MAG: hypothetical protein HYS25_03250 [Ignavibacteriales bacterium]|nr:hypothetical protein [Ignavibacteriales bacterium]